MKKIVLVLILVAILFFGCISISSESTKSIDSSAGKNYVPATSGGTASSGDELPPLPPDNEKIADTTAVTNDELPPLPE